MNYEPAVPSILPGGLNGCPEVLVCMTELEVDGLNWGTGSGVARWVMEVSEKFEIGSNSEPAFTQGDEYAQMHDGIRVQITQL